MKWAGSDEEERAAAGGCRRKARRRGVVGGRRGRGGERGREEETGCTDKSHPATPLHTNLALLDRAPGHPSPSLPPFHSPSLPASVAVRPHRPPALLPAHLARRSHPEARPRRRGRRGWSVPRHNPACSRGPSGACCHSRLGFCPPFPLLVFASPPTNPTPLARPPAPLQHIHPAAGCVDAPTRRHTQRMYATLPAPARRRVRCGEAAPGNPRPSPG